ncbi:MAG: hypothetical protein M3Z09_05900 [Acidobacteriota bacterium]|nr:hypothetical protein [Acidobacteriota bacterium]
MRRTRSVLLSCAVAVMSAGLSSSATISLDTVGGDPDLTSPFFKFMTDSDGGFSAIYRNVSNPPMNFVKLELTAPFSQVFYNGPNGPKKVGAACDGGHAFNACSVTFLDTQFTLIFDFFGTDGTHPGIPYQREFGLVAAVFEPNQTIQGAAAPGDAPEPGAFGLAAAGFVLAGVVMGGKQLLKSRIRS